MRRALPIVLTACAATSTSTSPAPSPAPEHAHHHQHGGPMHHRFEHADEWAKKFDDPARDAWQQPERVIAALELKPDSVVADVGAGTGYFAMRIAKQVPQGKVIATDIEPDMVRYLTERAQREQLPNVEARLAKEADPGLAPAGVDRILVVDVWHHLADRKAYAKALAAALAPGGMLAVVDFKLEAEQGPPKQHRLPSEAIIDDLRSAGLVAEVSATQLPDQYIVVARPRS
ncbi:MAG: methyltransferase [Kofleriaceae bacterium]|nr:methyltransferase [Kofleriaceae bacterium]